jgi:hypothetical protein
MGLYLNSKSAYVLYKGECQKPYFVDKSDLLEELYPIVSSGGNYICITRPRRFGKTMIANMIGAFFGKGIDSRDVFNQLSIAKSDEYQQHINQHNIIEITLNEISSNCRTYEQYMTRIEKKIKQDLKQAYPAYVLDEEDAVWDIFRGIFEEYGEQFIFIFDEWDFIFHCRFATEAEKKDYLTFLNVLLKDKPYVSLAYMTGILPISKYSSGSELNMFLEYTMITEKRFNDYFGFTESEVDMLYERYLAEVKEPDISRSDLKSWYDGYHTMSGERVYNPRSVVIALTNHNIGSYWTSSGPYDEIFYYIKNNVAEVRDFIALMVSGESVPSKVREYAATSMTLKTKEQIFSAMVVYGFLSYEQGKLSIPNRELMDKFEELLRTEDSLGYVYQLAKASEKMLHATIAGDTDTMAKILDYAHNTESPILTYNHETELSAIVNLVYLSARDNYRIEREEKAGKGFVDFIFYPINLSDDGIILELKIDDTADEAISQIKERGYALNFRGKMGEKVQYNGRVLAVGIGYYKKDKRHECKIEVL